MGSKRRGSVLLMVLMMSALIFVFMGVLGTDTVLNLRSGAETTERKQARYAAYAGIQTALNELTRKPDWNEEINRALPLDPKSSFSVKVVNNVYGTEDLEYEGITIPKGTVYLEALGSTSGTEAKRSVAGMSGLAYRSKTIFDNALAADSMARLTDGSLADSWDSAQGDYKTVKSLAKDDDSDKSYGLRQGTVASNDIVVLANSSKIDGDVLIQPPPGSDDPDFLSKDSSSTVTGQRLDMVRPAPIPAFRAPFAPEAATVSASYGDLEAPATDKLGNPLGPKWLPPGAYKDFTVSSGETVELRSGTYYFRDLLDIGGTVQVDASGGPVIIYVGKDLVLKGGLNPDPAGMSGSRRAKDVQVYFTDEKEVDPDFKDPDDPDLPDRISTLRVEGGRGSFVAAGAELQSVMENGDIYGAVLGDTLNLKATSVHFDTTLKGVGLAGISNWNLEGLHESYRR
ncbi:MAG: hypothetical protein HY319_17825 [Armatimonadetes bacterium]|nr:hypothetical protein [Armatimonadota bacterium]